MGKQTEKEISALNGAAHLGNDRGKTINDKEENEMEENDVLSIKNKMEKDIAEQDAISRERHHKWEVWFEKVEKLEKIPLEALKDMNEEERAEWHKAQEYIAKRNEFMARHDKRVAEREKKAWDAVGRYQMSEEEKNELEEAYWKDKREQKENTHDVPRDLLIYLEYVLMRAGEPYVIVDPSCGDSENFVGIYMNDHRFHTTLVSSCIGSSNWRSYRPEAGSCEWDSYLKEARCEKQRVESDRPDIPVISYETYEKRDFKKLLRIRNVSNFDPLEEDEELFEKAYLREDWERSGHHGIQIN